MVLFSHSAPIAGLPYTQLEQYIGKPWELYFGPIAVHAFFAISGYLIVRSWTKSANTFEFATHRFLRLFPALVFAAIYSAICFKITKPDAVGRIEILNGSLWTLSWEILCYIAVGILGILGVVNKKHYNVFFSVLLLLLAINISYDSFFIRKVIPALMCFAIGGLIALNEESINMRIAGIASGLILALLLFPPTANAIMALLVKTPISLGPVIPAIIIHKTIYYFALPFFIIYLGKYTATKIALKNDISYGVYIYSWPTQEFVVYFFRDIMGTPVSSPIQVFAVALPIVIGLSVLSWVLIERPCLELKHKIPSLLRKPREG
jgi:peptidoglycan/LPS O-acetylase OafA/YrhL